MLSLSLSKFLTYFSISRRSEFEATLLVVMMIPLLSEMIKSAQMLDLMFFRTWLMLIMWDAESLVNFLPSLLDIRTMTCLCEGPLVVILILGFSLSFFSLMTFCIVLIFLFKRSGNVFLIFNVFIATFEVVSLEAWLKETWV